MSDGPSTQVFHHSKRIGSTHMMYLKRLGCCAALLVATLVIAGCSGNTAKSHLDTSRGIGPQPGKDIKVGLDTRR
jgi:hypothetical protein